MRARAHQYAVALLDAAEGKSPAEIDRLTHRLGELLAAHKQMTLLPSIVKDCTRLAHRRRQAATLTTARVLPPGSFRHTLAKVLGGKVAVEERVDPAILGGAVLRFDDMLVDASVRTAFERLRQQLVRAPLTPVDF